MSAIEPPSSSPARSADTVADPLRQAIIDLCWAVTPFGEDDEGWITRYIVSSGPVHRLVGIAQGLGIPAALRATSPWRCLNCNHVRPHHRDDHARCHCGCPMYLPGDEERAHIDGSECA